MAGSAVKVTIDNREFVQLVSDVADRFGDTKPALEIIGETVVASVKENFEDGGRPAGWVELAEATIERKGHDKILIGSSQGSLEESIHSEIESDTVYVGTDKIYGAIHQFGGMAGRGKKVKIPQREYLMVQEEDWIEIKHELKDFLLTGET